MNCNKDIDEELLFDKLFVDNYKNLYNNAMTFINNSEIAKDLVNDAFEKLWIKFKGIDKAYDIKPYLYKSVRNLALNHIAHQKVHEKYSSYMSSFFNEEEKEDEDYDKVLEDLKKEIENLSPQSKIVFKKCFYENLTYKEVASELDISVNTVKTHIVKSLKILRKKFDNYSIFFIITHYDGC